MSTPSITELSHSEPAGVVNNEPENFPDAEDTVISDKLHEDVSQTNDDNDVTIMKTEAIAAEEERPSLASHHRTHHHHHHHHTHAGHDSIDVKEPDVYNIKTARSIGIISESAEEGRTVRAAADLSVSELGTQEKKRIPLASHHRKHLHHSSGEHRHHSSRSRQHRRDSKYVSTLQNPEAIERDKGQLTNVEFDAEEFERLYSDTMTEADEKSATSDSRHEEVLAETGVADARDPEDMNSVSRLASTIAAAHEANPRATRKASSIKSIGSRSRRKKATLFSIVIRILIAFAALLVGSICVLLYMRAHGQSTMTPKTDEIEIVMPEEDIPDAVEKVEDDGKTVTYKGQKYRWNDNLTTVLLIGTDRTVEQQESGVTMAGKNGQADTILLGVIDNMNKKISFINVNRDTYVPVAEYTSDGDYAGEKKMQICLSYAYGKDDKTSCRYTTEAVSKYLYGMPIDYYVRLSYDAIQVLNDSVGGVTLTVAEDLTSVDASLTQGRTVTLAGNQAMTYVRWRNKSIAETNENRINRQKQYLYAFMKRTIECTRQDFTLPLGLFANAKPYMTTNVTTSQVTYLASKVLEYGIADDAIHSIPGKSVIGKDNHVEYYPDATALYERVLDTFYNKAE